MRRLTEGYSPLVPSEVRSYFRDVDDHLATVAERVASFDELLTTLVDAALAKITLRQNNDMRKITAYAALLAVPTMLAGIYGMNFDYMPELHSRSATPRSCSRSDHLRGALADLPPQPLALTSPLARSSGSRVPRSAGTPSRTP